MKTMFLFTKKLFWWDVYVLLLGINALTAFHSAFNHHAPQWLYYDFLLHFDRGFFLPAFFAAARPGALLLFSFGTGMALRQKNMGPTALWKFFLGLRILADLFGQSYQWQDTLSLFGVNPGIAWAAIIWGIGYYLPSYIICFRYAFLNKPSLAT
ncbi:MAG: hypothetical protein HQL23_08325 [Candidatus Omnitrophica bacterium]|nr:hypothetical protein [Candidatus Omnitrophota bacterium]